MGWWIEAIHAKWAIGVTYSLLRSSVKCTRQVHHRACDKACLKCGRVLFMKHDTGAPGAEVDHKVSYRLARGREW